MYEFLKVERDPPVGVVTLHRPDVLNAWHSPMRDELLDALEAMDGDPDVRAVILTGSGDRAFSAGQDLEETSRFDVDRAEEWVGEWDALYDGMRRMATPVVAALNGVAAGSGFQVALLCDVRVGHQGSRLGQPEIKSGIASTLGPWLMREMLGLSRAIELTLTGRLMDGEEGHAIGLIHHLVPEAEVMPKAMEVARTLAEMPPVAMRLNKENFRRVTEPGFEDAVSSGKRVQRESYATGEPQRMMEAFLAKRRAKREGREAEEGSAAERS